MAAHIRHTFGRTPVDFDDFAALYVEWEFLFKTGWLPRQPEQRSNKK
jgi:hypothetical protein